MLSLLVLVNVHVVQDFIILCLILNLTRPVSAIPVNFAQQDNIELIVLETVQEHALLVHRVAQGNTNMMYVLEYLTLDVNLV